MASTSLGREGETDTRAKADSARIRFQAILDVFEDADRLQKLEAKRLLAQAGSDRAFHPASAGQWRPSVRPRFLRFRRFSGIGVQLQQGESEAADIESSGL